MATQVFKSWIYRTDFFFTKEGLGNKYFAKISVFGAEIFPKSERNGPKKCQILQKRNTDGHKN